MPKWVPIALVLFGIGVAIAPTDGCNLPIPIPIVDPVVDPAKTEGSYVVVIEQTEDRTPAIAKLLGQDLKTELEARGLRYRAYDVDSDEAKPYKTIATTLPYLLVMLPDGKILASKPLPLPKSAFDAAVKEATGR